MQKNKPEKIKLPKSYDTLRQFRELISIILGMLLTITAITKNIIDIFK